MQEFITRAKKNRIQVLIKTLGDCYKIQYVSKIRKHTLYKKI